jgi:hypothetical protein
MYDLFTIPGDASEQQHGEWRMLKDAEKERVRTRSGELHL